MIENEHWKLDETGKLEGLFTIDPTKAKSSSHDDGSVNNVAYWEKVEQVVKAYVKVHPQEVAECLEEVRIARSGIYNPFGENLNTSELELHHPAKIPLGLLRVLEVMNPEIFEDRKYYRKFLQKFPGFYVGRLV